MGSLTHISSPLNPSGLQVLALTYRMDQCFSSTPWEIIQTTRDFQNYSNAIQCSRLLNCFQDGSLTNLTLYSHFFAVSGSGKTRVSLEGLCHEWGLYITCGGGDMGQPSGSGDFKAATLIMESMSDWDGEADNVEVAHRAFAMLICARVFVLKSLLEKLPSGTDPETARRRWVLAQVLPPFHRSKDIFTTVLDSLRAAFKADLIPHTDSMLNSLIDRLGSKFFPGRLFAVVDEAQVAAEYLNESFRSVTSGSEKRPVLHPLYSFLWSNNVFKGVVLAGTGLSSKMVRKATASHFAQQYAYSQVPIVFVDVGRFKKDETLHKSYIEKYLTFSQSVTDQRLMERILYWFHGRWAQR